MKLLLCRLPMLIAIASARIGREFTKPHGSGRSLIREEHTRAQPFTQRAAEIVTTISIQNSFDSRAAWPNCRSIGEIREQGECGSCWAVAAAGAISDRICIASNGTQTPILSALDILSCAESEGCRGGAVDQGWHYWLNSGVVTGGEAGTSGTCEPYNLPPTDLPSCSHTCASGYPTPYASDKHFGSKVAIVPSSVSAIQKEIMTNGPVESAFTVYSDFYHDYEGGVYYKGCYGFTPSNLGGHAIKIIGWGVDNGLDYWLIANSWGTSWGEEGFFRMRRGTDECGIETDVVAGIPRL